MIQNQENSNFSEEPCCGVSPSGMSPCKMFPGKVDTHLSWSDKLGGLKARLTINRKNYKVDPGVYAAGTPTADSVVLVSANYKLSFDALRKELDGIDAWIMVIDTKGINVWCAAGKGTFGTEEIVSRIREAGLEKKVNHRQIILPQLGAPGVAAHEVKKLSGFSVLYGPVRATDIPAFLEAGKKTTPRMRAVRFSFYDRLSLVPAEVAAEIKYIFFIIAIFFVLSGLTRGGYSADLMRNKGVTSAVNLLLAYLAGTAMGPLFLPWLPGKSFSLKGFFAGAAVFAFSFFIGFAGSGPLEIAAWALLMCGLASFATMNFTGASTYTSLSGVIKEMQVALPVQLIFVILGFGLWLAARFM